MPRKLSFVCALPCWSSGSSYLRTFQLAELAAQRLSAVRVRELAELDGEIGDEVLVFNKSCLQPPFLGGVLERLGALRHRCICLADPVDLALPEEVLERFDGAIAASIGQAEHFSTRLSKPVFLIHHHVDLRLRPEPRQWNEARIAYFGELANACHADALFDLVDFFSVDTTNASEISWARHLPYYNAHYCLRRPRRNDGFKPATKLFVAARFDAPAVVERENHEARRLLPPDYPYFASSLELEDVRAILRCVMATFGKEEWLYARRCMAAIDCYRPERVLDSIEDMMRRLG